MIAQIFSLLFGDGRNVLRETAAIFRPNAEAADARDAAWRAAALRQFAAEFAQPRAGLFDRVIDGLNRVPRPAMAFGVLGLMVAAMADPVWFAARMQGIALVPEPLWWLMGAIVSFYFGARHQAKGQEFRRSVAATLADAPGVAREIAALERLRAGAPEAPEIAAPDAPDEPGWPGAPNPALAAWRAGREGADG